MGTRQRQFEALVQAYSTQLYRFAVWLCRDREQAQDLVQETFMRAWKGLDSLQDHSRAKHWLITILRRENARRFERKQLDTVSLDGIELTDLSAFTAGSHIEAFVLRQALAGLAWEYREPLLLQVLGGFSCDEIAELIGIKPGAVMTRLSRARQKLRSCLDGESAATSQKGGA